MKAQNSNLVNWLTDAKSSAYFGRSFQVKADVLAQIIGGVGTLADIGRKHGISKQAVWKHARKARAIYFEPSATVQPKVDYKPFRNEKFT